MKKRLTVILTGVLILALAALVMTQFQMLRDAADYAHFYFAYPHPRGSQVPNSAENYTMRQLYQLVSAREGSVVLAIPPFYRIMSLRERRAYPDLRAAFLFPRGIYRYFGRWFKPDYALLSPIQAEALQRPLPHWLFFSNSPEGMDPQQLPAAGAILARGRLEAGTTRLFISHWGLGKVGLDQVLLVRNRNHGPAHFHITKLGMQGGQNGQGRPSLQVGYLAQLQFDHDVRDQLHLLPGGGVEQIPLVMNNFGCGTTIMELQSDSALELVVVGKAAGTRLVDRTPDRLTALPRQGTMVRGVFACPDFKVDAVFNPSQGIIQRYTFGGGNWSERFATMVDCQWLAGVDQTISFQHPDPVINKGNYGSIYDFSLAIHNPPGSKYQRVVLVVVAAGGEASINLRGAPVDIPGHMAVVLLNDIVSSDRTFNLNFTYVANSSAPMHLIAIPLPR